ncbi:hypothetical protein DMP17_44720 [Pseudonocardia sp. TMWB2A]|uniref:glycosyltransferase n=1 Tax=Pseudonocardia sp. TMWB2A TaxID=687430 RepID=UPI00307F8E93
MLEPTTMPTSGQTSGATSVLFVDHTAVLSGAEIKLRRYCNHLVGRPEFDVRVLLGAHGPLETALRGDGVTVEVVPLPKQVATLRRAQLRDLRNVLRACWLIASYVLRLRRVLRRSGADFYHSFSLKSNIYVGVAALGLPGCHIWQANDHVSTGYLGSGVVARVVRTLPRVLRSHVSANSVSTAQTYPAATPHSVVYPPLPTGWPDALEQWTPTPGPARIGMVGRISPWKGQDVFLRAFAAEFRGSSVEAVIVGAALFGESDYAAELVALCKSLDISDQVTFAGNSSDVPGELSQMSCLVHCSVLPEPFGQVVSEAMAVGVPVIAARAGGPLEIIDDRHTGLLVAPGDVDGLRVAMRRLLDDTAFAVGLGQAGREASRRFGDDEFVAALQAMFDHARAR